LNTTYPDDFRVSIIITSYNGKGYLIEALESVMLQSLRPYEIIIADDGSSDGSQDTIQSYVDRYPDWIRAVYQPHNIGIPRNRNAALQIVKGNYVGILDGDDLFLPNKLECQYQALCAFPDARAVYSNFRRFAPDGTTLNYRYLVPQPQGNILPAVAMFNTGFPRTMVADYEAVKASGFMDERFLKYDGLWLTIKLASFCQFAYTHESLVDKREYVESDSRQNLDQDYLDLSGIYKEMQPLLKDLDSRTRLHIHEYWVQILNKIKP
jgi:glycosyltransferase involved in cell wall biosynthesis